MSLNRNTFIEAFAQSSPALNVIFLNHLGAPSKLLADVSTIEMLSDKNATTGFIEYCKSHPLVKDLIVSHNYRRTNILVEFLDGSEMNFCLLSNLVRKALLCLDTAAIRKSAHVNEFGMLVPGREYHFEYMTLRCQFDKDPLSDRYRNYFAGFDLSSRAVIFKYMQTRFNLIFNTLDDLYEPSPKMLLSMMIGLRAEKGNTLFKMFLRAIEFGVFNLLGWYTKKPFQIAVSDKHSPPLPAKEKKRSAGAVL
jgi:hypothetical protein